MQTTTVSQLKMSLSAYLRQVKAGEEVVITEHGRPIARLLPLSSPVPFPEHLRDLEEKGLLKRERSPYPRIFGIYRVLLTPRQPCVRRSCASGRKAGEILGYVGCGAAVCARA